MLKVTFLPEAQPSITQFIFSRLLSHCLIYRKCPFPLKAVDLLTCHNYMINNLDIDPSKGLNQIAGQLVVVRRRLRAA
jgi:hypothetical protein